ncbi:MAG TPA: lyase family protein [Magnetospirillaceae bacterium]|nr:lyase family protein [Magnetospirillaceae bacterium]
MRSRDVFDNLSPLDHRYWETNRELFDALADRLSDRASVRECVKVEIALLKAHLAARGLSSEERFRELDALEGSVDPGEVAREEAKTRHNIRALVNILASKVPAELAHLVHLGATSADILDTARALQFRSAVLEVLLPLLARVLAQVARIAEEEAETAQVGRTHGRHAVPITFGFAMAEYAARLGKCLPRIEELARDLRGKLAGATGSYNALAIVYPDPEGVEAAFLSFLDLRPSEHSTQIVEPEYLLRLLLELNVAFGILANLADDLRHLQRQEIDEVRESFAGSQVGSSTMPQKRNPWNCEHVKSLWKAFAPRVLTFFLDQISEHQRDLTNSASERFAVEFLAGLGAAANRIHGVLCSLSVDREQMGLNLRSGGGAVMAELAYILLAESGRADAHEEVRRLTLAAEAEGISFAEALERRPLLRQDLSARLIALGHPDPWGFFVAPERYRGLAAQKARALGKKYLELARRWQNGPVRATRTTSKPTEAP